VCASSGEVSRRPFDDPGDGDLPPEGIWVSRKGDAIMAVNSGSNYHGGPEMITKL
jgi:hypothetical protein